MRTNKVEKEGSNDERTKEKRRLERASLRKTAIHDYG